MQVNRQFHAKAALPLGKDAHVTHWRGGWIGSRVGLDVVKKRNISWPHKESNTDSKVVSQLPSHYTD
jgi:hypothetical protein